jgi:UDP:flavonoid glycosyltransferase YjiC (YdhE family)
VAAAPSVLFAPYSARGHVAPMLVVAARLAARGCRVRMVAGERFAAAIRTAGVVPVVYADHEARVPAGWTAPALTERVGVRVRKASARRAAGRACAVAVVAERPGVVVTDPMAPWADAVCARRGIPTVRFWTTHARPRRVGRGELVNALPELQPKGMRRGSRVRFVGPLVGGMSTPDPGIPWNRLSQGPVLVVSPGTVFARTAAFYRALLAEFARTPWTVVMATGHVPPTALGPLPANVLGYRWIPQYQLLRWADVLLTHAGMNSVQEAICRGVPMLLAPRCREQRATARRLVQLGLGTFDSGRGWRRQAEQLLADDATRARSDAMRRRVMARTGATDAVTALLRTAGVDVACQVCHPVPLEADSVGRVTPPSGRGR